MDIHVGSIQISLISTFKTKRLLIMGWVIFDISLYIFVLKRICHRVYTYYLYTNSMLKDGQCYTDLFSLLFSCVFGIIILKWYFNMLKWKI